MTFVLHALGGCHLNGYPYGFEKSFVDLAVAELAPTDVDVRRVAPASFRKLNDYLEHPANPIEGGVVLFQIGHFESIEGSWRVLANATNEPRQQPEDADPARMQGFFRSLTVTSFLLNLVKLAVFHWSEFRGRVFFDPEAFETRLEDMFRRLLARRPARVIVLSALPTTAADVNICRKRLNAVMRAVTERFGFDYVDAYDTISQARRRLHLDVLHLNEAGHEAMAGVIAEPLARGAREAHESEPSIEALNTGSRYTLRSAG